MKHTLQTVALDAITSGPMQDRQATSEALQLDGPNGVIAQIVKGPEGMEAVGQVDPVVLISSKEVAKIMTLVGARRLLGLRSMKKTECFAMIVTGFKSTKKSSAKDQVLALCHQSNMSAHYTQSDIARMVWRWLGSVSAKVAAERVKTVCHQATAWSEQDAKNAAYLVDVDIDNVWERIDAGQWSINLAKNIVKIALDLSDTQVADIAKKYGLKADDTETVEQKVYDKTFSYMSVRANRKGLMVKGEKKQVLAVFCGPKGATYSYQAGIDSLTKEERKSFKANVATVAQMCEGGGKKKVATWTTLLGSGDEAKRFRALQNATRVAISLGYDLEHFDARITSK